MSTQSPSLPFVLFPVSEAAAMVSGITYDVTDGDSAHNARLNSVSELIRAQNRELKCRKKPHSHFAKLVASRKCIITSEISRFVVSFGLGS
jgi:hypothetical protein